MSASQAGAKVLVLESAEVMGGAGSPCSGSVTAPLSSLQKKAGVTDSVEAYMEDILKLAGPKASRMDKTFLRLLAGSSWASIDWLLRLGVDIRGPFEYPDMRVPRMHNMHRVRHLHKFHRASVDLCAGCPGFPDTRPGWTLPAVGRSSFAPVGALVDQELPSSR